MKKLLIALLYLVIGFMWGSTMYGCRPDKKEVSTLEQLSYKKGYYAGCDSSYKHTRSVLFTCWKNGYLQGALNYKRTDGFSWQQYRIDSSKFLFIIKK